MIINANFIWCALINQNSWKSALLFLLNLILVFFNLWILIFCNAYPWSYFFYFEFRQKLHIVYFWPHVLFRAQNFCKNWNAVPYSYYYCKALISDWWWPYKTRKLKSVFLAYFFLNPIQYSILWTCTCNFF